VQIDREAPVNALGLLASIGRHWMIDEGYAGTIILALEGMTLADVARAHAANRAAAGPGNTSPPSYRAEDGVAYIGIGGPMTKQANSMQEMFGGTATVSVQEAIRKAVADDAVQSIMLVFDTPGGTVDGSFDLADTVRRAGKIKPIDGYAQDNCCSAGYLILAQCRNAYANVNAIVGSIGVYTELVDTTRREEMQGIKRYVVYAGEQKAIGRRPVEDEHLGVVQKRMDSLMGLFARSVAKGRGMDEKQLARVANGGMFVGAEAKRVGLVDAIMSMDSAHADVLSTRKPGGKKRKETSAMAQDVDLSVVRGWLAEDDTAAAAQEAATDAAANDDTNQAATAADAAQAAADGDGQPAAEAVGAAAAAVETPAAAATAWSPDPALATALNAAGVHDVAAFNSLVARATVGDDYFGRLKTQTKQLAVIALGPEAGANAAQLVDSHGVDNMTALRGLAQQYEQIAVTKGLLPPPGGAPMQRNTAPGAHPQVGHAGAATTPNMASADNTGTLTQTPEQLAAANIRERRASGIYGM